MSAMQSVTTDSPLPTFEPRQNRPAQLGKRKRAKPSQDVSSPNKKAKDVEKDEVPLVLQEETPLCSPTEMEDRHPDTGIAVWIGASAEKIESPQVGGVSVYYGKDDSRNWSDVCDLEQHSSLDNLYALGALHAIETCSDDTSSLTIYTGCHGLLDIDTESEEKIHPLNSELRDQLKEKISERSGTTQFAIYSEDSTEDEEQQAAYDLAQSVAQSEKDSEHEEQAKAESDEVSVETLVVASAKQEDEKKEEELSEIDSTSAESSTTDAPQGWGSVLGINLFELLKAPFRRG